MAGFVDGNRALLLFGHHLRLLLQSANDTVYGIQEVLLAYLLTIVASGYQGCLVADVSNVGTRKTWCLASQELDVQILVQLQGFQMNLEYLQTFVQVGQVDMYLTVETTCAHQR